MNTIYLSQSTKENMDLLYAQSHLYNKIKKFSNLNFVISIIVPIILSILAAFLKSKLGFSQEKISAYLGVYGLVVLALNIGLNGYIASERKKAATIQEMYDCNVLKVKWNDLKVGKQIARDVVFRAASYYLSRPKKAMKRFGDKGWYVNKKYNAPQNVMTLLCQGKNFGWEASLRSRLNVIYIFGMSISFLSLMLYAISMDAKLNDMLFYVVFTLPLLRYFLMQFVDNRKGRDRAQKLKDYIDKEISDIKIAGIVHDDVLNYKLRSIQDEIFVHRSSSPSVPNYIHLTMKKVNESVFEDYFDDNLRVMNLKNE